MKSFYKYFLIIFSLGLMLSVNILFAQHKDITPVVKDSLMLDQYHYTIVNELNQINISSELVNFVKTWFDFTGPSRKSYELYQDNLLMKSVSRYNQYFVNHYDDQGKITRRDIINHYYSLYSYDSNSNLIEVLTYLYSGDPYYRISYQYDNNGYLISSLIENWEATFWMYESQRIYTNNENGLVIESITQSWTGTEWRNSFKLEHHYDSNELKTKIVRQNWNNGIWENFYQNLYTYNYLELLSEDIRQYWSNDAWQNSNKTTYLYNEEDVVIELSNYNWSNNQWQLNTLEITEIVEGPFIGLIYPEENENYLPDSPLYIQWAANGIDEVNIEFSSDNGAKWTNVVSNLPDTGSYDYNWSIPPEEYDLCKIRVSDASNPSIFAENYDPFTLLFDYDYLDTSTDIATLTVKANGEISNDGIGIEGVAEGFRFMDYPNALFTGGIMLGNTENHFVGMASSFLYEDMVKSGIMPQPTSNENFNEITLATFDDSNAPFPYNVEIEQKTYAKSDDPYIYCVYDVKNNSNNTLENFYIGMFLDWDIGDFVQNIGGYEEELNLVYQFEENGTDPNYYGVVALDGMTGARLLLNQEYHSREAMIDYMSTFLNEEISITSDYSSVIGSGPFSILPNDNQLVGFAIVAGTTLDNLKENSAVAQQEWNSGIVAVEEEEERPHEFTLSQNYPNPFNPSTKINYSVPRAGHISLKVYDILGREVVTLVNEIKQPGQHEIRFNGSNLASGIYFYRLKSKDYVETKKLILLR